MDIKKPGLRYCRSKSHHAVLNVAFTAQASMQLVNKAHVLVIVVVVIHQLMLLTFMLANQAARHLQYVLIYQQLHRERQRTHS